MNNEILTFESLLFKVEKYCQESDFKDFMGKRWNYYYNLKSKKFNFIAFLFSIPWLIYRKLYKTAFILLGINIFISIISYIFQNYQSLIFQLVILIFNLCIAIYFGINGNTICLLRLYNWKKNNLYQKYNYKFNRFIITLFFLVSFYLLRLLCIKAYDIYQRQFQYTYEVNDNYILGGVKGYKTKNGFIVLLHNTDNEDGYIVKISNTGQEQMRFRIPHVNNYFANPVGVFAEDDNENIYILYCSTAFYSNKIIKMNDSDYEVTELSEEVTSFSEFYKLIGIAPNKIYKENLDWYFSNTHILDRHKYELNNSNSGALNISKLNENNDNIFNKSYIRLISSFPDLPTFVKGTEEIYIVGYLHEKKSFYISKINTNGDLMKVFN